MRTFSVNGKLYKAVPFTFNLLADLEEMGISLENMQKKPMSTLRAYFALCAGGDADYAGEQLEQHLIGGGDLSALSDAMAGEMNDSDFFRHLATKSSEDSVESEEPKPQKKTKK